MIGPVLPLAPSQWQVLITEVRHGNYDTLG